VKPDGITGGRFIFQVVDKKAERLGLREK
jgi:hypothetical protein